MANLLTADYFAVTLSLEDWVGLVTGTFYNYAAEGFYKNGVLQVKLGPAVFTGAVINYAILLDDVAWGLGDPTSSEHAGLVEEFVISYSGTARIKFHPPDGRTYEVCILDGKYVSADQYDRAMYANVAMPIRNGEDAALEVSAFGTV